MKTKSIPFGKSDTTVKEVDILKHCFSCENISHCGIFRKIRDIYNEYDFCSHSKLYIAIGNVCKYYKSEIVKVLKDENT